jgi:lipid-binding SYLF domain-containing protein
LAIESLRKRLQEDDHEGAAHRRRRYGVVVDNETKARTYVKVREFQLGGGWGAKAMSTVVIFHSDEVMEKVRTGTWQIGASAGASAGDKGACGGTGGEGYTPYVFNDKGAAATATFNILRITSYSSLNKK